MSEGGIGGGGIPQKGRLDGAIANGSEVLARLKDALFSEAAQCRIGEAQLCADLTCRERERHLFERSQIQEPPTGSVAIPPRPALHLLGILERVHFQAVARSPARSKLRLAGSRAALTQLVVA